MGAVSADHEAFSSLSGHWALLLHLHQAFGVAIAYYSSFMW